MMATKQVGLAHWDHSEAAGGTSTPAREGQRRREAPPTCLEPAILGEGASRFFWSVPVFSEHGRPSDQQLPFLLLEPRGHLQHGRQRTLLRRGAPPAFLVTPSPHPLLKLDTSLEMIENASFNTRPQACGHHGRECVSPCSPSGLEARRP